MDYTKLIKESSYDLHHYLWEYEPKLDSEGFGSVEQLINAINEISNYDRLINISDLEYIIENDVIVPPNVLYHGTTHKVLDAILSDIFT